ncbi:MAG: Zinc uptake regulation protein [Chlamydiales bacterium]|nr:Zinc uptake regulation protein [Chlamydiales bacterium]
MNQDVIEQAKAFCIEQKERLTRPRLEVLKIIAESQKPIGAYAILGRLSLVVEQPKPQTVYRALDFWLQTGFIHSIKSLNAYTLCQAGQRHQGCGFMICHACGKAIEAAICEVPASLKDCLKKKNFTPIRWTMEIHGSCSDCL